MRVSVGVRGVGVRSVVLGIESDAGLSGLEGTREAGIPLRGPVVCLLGEIDCRRGARDMKSSLSFVVSTAAGGPSGL
jgi:hypothetical protein